jgi:hypothetical protein
MTTADENVPSSSSSPSVLEVQTALESYVRRVSDDEHFDLTMFLATLLAPIISSPDFDEISFVEVAKRQKTTTGESIDVFLASS